MKIAYFGAKLFAWRIALIALLSKMDFPILQPSGIIALSQRCRCFRNNKRNRD